MKEKRQNSGKRCLASSPCVLAAALTAIGAFAQEKECAVGFSIDVNRPSMVYDVGEEAVLTVTATNGRGNKVTAGVVEVTVDAYAEERKKTHTVDLARENPFVVRGTLKEPGFLRFALSGEGVRRTVRGVGFAPDRIRPVGVCPADFDTFWADSCARLEREVPLDPQLTPVPERSTDAYDFWRVSFATFGGQRVWGFLTVPKDKSKAPYPVRFMISSAGTGRWTWDFESPRDQDGVINMSFTIHAFDPPTNQKDADRLHEELGKSLKAKYGDASYAVAGLGKSREDVYFYRPILGINRAVNWLWSRPDVDRSRFCYQGGSQGGGLGMMLLGLNRKFTAAFLHVPAMMDALGCLEGRESGFPGVSWHFRGRDDRSAALKNMAYYNGAFFAARVTCPVRMAMGFMDEICPPTGVYAAYNSLKVKDKDICHGLLRGHGWWPESEIWEEWLRKHNGEACGGFPLETRNIRMRDPFVVTDFSRGRYCLVSSYFLKEGSPTNYFGFLGTGVQVYESVDLVHWSRPRPVLNVPAKVDCQEFWAPEVHRFRDKWYVLGTVKNDRLGTWAFVSDRLTGPYRPTGNRSITPPEWRALDGTLWEEDGHPYMVFCHEWSQIGVGEVCLVRMKDDLSAPDGEPKTLFKATDYAKDVDLSKLESPVGRVTDGPFLHRSDKSGKLFMIWSNIVPGAGYADILCESSTGKVSGPWVNHRLLFGRDGGHGMIFRKLDGGLGLVLHQPNAVPHERPLFLDLEDDGTTLRVVERRRSVADFDPRIAGDRSPADTDGLEWIDGRALPLESRGFANVERPFDRLPADLAACYSEGVRVMQRQATGHYFLFVTDSDKLAVEWELEDKSERDPYIPPQGLFGVDIYRHEEKTGWRFVSNGRLAPLNEPLNRMKVDLPQGRKPILVYLPTRGVVKSVRLGVKPGSHLERYRRPSGVIKPVVHYGTSIVHGGCASRPGLCFTSQAARLADVPYVNLGFSGCAKLELVMAEAMARVDASLYLVDPVWNCDPALVRERAEPFLRKLHELRPDVPILVCEGGEPWGGRLPSNEALKEVYDRLKAEGSSLSSRLRYLEAKGMIPADGESTHDYCHPNDYGSMQMGKVFAAAIRDAIEGKVK